MNTDPKRLGVLIRQGREEEGLRMSGALTLCDDIVEVLILSADLKNNAEIALHLDTLELCEIPIYACFEDSRLTTITQNEMSKRLIDYDAVVTF